MFFLNLLFALIFGLLITIVFAAGFNRRGPWNNIIIFFVIVFLATWAGGIWIIPFGPNLFGVAWLPYLLIALLVGLGLASSASSEIKEKEKLIQDRKKNKEEKVKRFDLFFFALVTVLVIMIVLRYIVII